MKNALAFLVLLSAVAAGHSCSTRPPAPQDDAAIEAYLDRIHSLERWGNVSPADGKFLRDFILRHGLRNGVEVGTSNGYSALWMGMAFRRTGGRLLTLEYLPDRAAEAKRNVAQVGLQDVIEVRAGDALQVLPQLQGPFDFVFIDAYKPDYDLHFLLVYPQVAPGGYILAHDVFYHAEMMPDFFDIIHNHPHLETTMERAGGAGISVSRKRPAAAAPPPVAEEEAAARVQLLPERVVHPRGDSTGGVTLLIKIKNAGPQPFFVEVLEDEQLSLPSLARAALEQRQPDGSWKDTGAVLSPTASPHLQEVSPGETTLVRLQTTALSPAAGNEPGNTPATGLFRLTLEYFESGAAARAVQAGKTAAPASRAQSEAFLIPLE